MIRFCFEQPFLAHCFCIMYSYFSSPFSDKYVTDAQNLHEHVMRHNHGTDENGTSINCLKIGFDTEYPLYLIIRALEFYQKTMWYYNEKINSRFSSHFVSICVGCSIAGIFCSNFKRKAIYLNSTF